MLIELLNIVASTGRLYPEICDRAMIAWHFHHSDAELTETINTAKKQGFLTQNGDEYALTEKGKKRVQR